VRATRAWDQLRANAPQGVHLDNRVVPLADLEKELARLPTAAAPAPGGWPLFRGDVARSGQGTGFLPQLEPRWAQPTAYEAVSQEWLQAAVRQEEARAQPVLPGAVPVVAGGRVFYRSARGLHAVDCRT